MPDITTLITPRRVAAPSAQQLPARGLVAVPPGSLADDIVTVTLPSYSADYGWPCRWIRQGNTLPAIGAECLVLWDETGAGTVVQWAGAMEAEGVRKRGTTTLTWAAGAQFSNVVTGILHGFASAPRIYPAVQDVGGPNLVAVQAFNVSSTTFQMQGWIASGTWTAGGTHLVAWEAVL